MPMKADAVLTKTSEENNMNDAKVLFLKALNKVQGTIDPVHKDSTNPHFKSKYASLAAVNETIMGPLSESGFVVMSGGVDINGKPYLRTSLFHVGGHSESFDYPLIEKTDNPQHIASSVTYARRYALCALLNLSVDDDDGNSATDSVKTFAREPASFTAKKAAESAAVAVPSGEIEVARFIPSRVMFVEGKGKGAGKVFGEIYDGNTKYGGDEMQGQMAESAKSQGKEIVVAFKSNGIYKNINRGGVKFAENIPASEIDESIPF